MTDLGLQNRYLLLHFGQSTLGFFAGGDFGVQLRFGALQAAGLRGGGVGGGGVAPDEVINAREGFDYPLKPDEMEWMLGFFKS